MDEGQNIIRALTNMWSIPWTPQIMKVLKTINYYQLVGCVDFGMGIYNLAKFLDEGQIPIQEEIARWLTSLKISNLWEAINQAFHQS